MLAAPLMEVGDHGWYFLRSGFYVASSSIVHIYFLVKIIFQSSFCGKLCKFCLFALRYAYIKQLEVLRVKGAGHIL